MLRVGLLLTIALLVSQVAVLALLPGEFAIWLPQLIVLAAGLLGVLGLGYGSYHTRDTISSLRLAWLSLVAGGCFWTWGHLALFFYQQFYPELPFPSWADGFFLAVFPCLLVGIMFIPVPRRTPAELAELLLDIAVIILSAGLIFWNYLIGPLFLIDPPDIFKLVVTTAYPIADVILLWAAIVLISLKFTRQPRRPLWLLFTALVMLVMLDTIETYRRVTGIDIGADIIYFLRTAVPLLFMLSGLVQAVSMQAQSRGEAQEAGFDDGAGMDLVRMTLPYLWLGCAYLALCLGPSSVQVVSVFLMSAWVAVILLLVMIRQVIMMRENLTLTQQLNRLNTDLEQLFVERTAALIRTNEELRREVYERDRMETLLQDRDNKLVYYSLHDTLTGLPNRALLVERLGQALRRIKRQEEYHFAVLYLDFDGFKYINDSLGHEVGDQLLVAIANRLNACVREIDTVARLGGDEFVVMVDGVAHEEDAVVAVKRVQEFLAAPFDLEGHKVFMSASIGVVNGDASYDHPSDILRDADLAMYQAKASGKSRYVIFVPEMRVNALNRMILENDMRLALERGEFQVHYQPILELDKDVIVGFEALLRWNHPTHGSIPPDDFIPVAENSGLIVAITEWVLFQACQQLRDWMNEFAPQPSLTVSVNLSAKLFGEPNLPQMVERVLKQTNLPARNLKLEITETALVEDAETATRMLNMCRRMGIQVYIDDFGTGYSALSYLHQFPVDTLKIDRAFIRRIRENGENTEVVRTILALARELNLEVIAEGVETAEQFAFLKKMGCQGGQGFYIARPLDSQATHDLISKRLKPGGTLNPATRPRRD